jgi:hypothetical protein
MNANLAALHESESGPKPTNFVACGWSGIEGQTGLCIGDPSTLASDPKQTSLALTPSVARMNGATCEPGHRYAPPATQLLSRIFSSTEKIRLHSAFTRPQVI